MTHSPRVIWGVVLILLWYTSFLAISVFCFSRAVDFASSWLHEFFSSLMSSFVPLISICCLLNSPLINAQYVSTSMTLVSRFSYRFSIDVTFRLMESTVCSTFPEETVSALTSSLKVLAQTGVV